MELIRLKRRIAFARRGHKLLKDKRDSMMKEFMTLVKQARGAQVKAERLYSECRSLLLESAAYSSYQELLVASAGEGEKMSTSVRYSNVMSIRIPTFSQNSANYEPQFGDLAPKGAKKLFKMHKELVLATLTLATLEKGIRLMAREIETTNRRVNALEHILIPRFESDAKAIEFKLDEREREMFSTLNRMSE
jgi:V/A-type H+/Na+-transporting ATPase subunit D